MNEDYALGSWMKALGVQPWKVIVVNNLLAMIGLTDSLLGIGTLPTQCLEPIVSIGSLMVVPCTPALPAITYVASFKGDSRSTLISLIVMLAQVLRLPTNVSPR